ncbi:MAG: NAD(P)H-dependent oxidoreductase subunit E [Elusimicrobia bacterium]|nr:NAD(P)H-dependent oxidoreductase subunit E [Elusimicrobiota bacterium]
MTEQKLKELLAKWEGRRGNLIMIFHEIQNTYGYVPRRISLRLSEMLDVPLAQIYEVLTFYHYFKLEKPGKHTIAICMGTACYLKGAAVVLKEFKDILRIDEDKTTEDGKFYLTTVRCVGCCGLAPVVTVDGKVYSKVERTQVAGILSDFLAKEEEKETNE